MKKLITILLILMFLVYTIPGCSSNQNNSNESSSQSSISTSLDEKNEEKSVLPFAETFKITQAEVWRPENDTYVLTYDVMQKRLNMEIEYIRMPVASAKEQLAIILSSGDIPDVINFAGSGSTFTDWIKYEAIIPLDNLIKEHAQDLVSKLRDEDYIYLKHPDGKIYSVPSQGSDVSKAVGKASLCIRQDWLDNLNLKMPVTLDEWEAVLTAFKNNDPNGNGKNDEIPFGGSFDAIWDAYGLRQLYVRNDDNTLTLKYVDKYFLEAVSKLADWDAKGLIDQEYITRNKNLTEVQAIVYNGICGTMWMTGNHTTAVTKTLRTAGIEDALFVSAKLIEGPRGRNVAARGSVSPISCTISAKTEEPVKIMQYLNYPFTEEGTELFNYGVEGETFDIVNGKKVIKQELIDGGWNVFRSYGMFKVGGIGTFVLGDMFLQMTFEGKTVETMDEITALAYTAYTDEDIAEYKYQEFPSSLNQVQAYIDYDGASLTTELEDMVDQVIMGIKSIGELEKLIDDVYTNGFEQIEKEANELWAILSK